MKRNQLSRFEVKVILRAACKAAGGQNAWARAHGVSNAYVSDVLSGRRNPGQKILAPLKLYEVVQPAEHWYEREAK